ncbi:LLM class flavin-dependent oxidoreductase [Pseudonocardia alaniniphila]|uniref:LLM class flavin-dependent oxidoreductase n=1 Tax=Pseudonocardia alaniniphila TaxID=75291 RepID=A0ABS9TS81_9PSEU|nr:LLM class flavin-dependent oxidoreductase [Pseudonocardia alaniniphila]MCH6171371.1 LLM class flavin-dependent oxidoreductase [Pseudonocardia alaniniphila]
MKFHWFAEVTYDGLPGAFPAPGAGTWVDAPVDLADPREIAGFVFGAPMDSAFAYPRPPVELRERFHEARELVLRAWREREPFAPNGKFTQLRYVNLWPRPVQERPAVWVPGSNSVETWELVTRENYCYGHLSFSGLRAAKPPVDCYWDYVAAHDGDLNPHRMAFTQLICVADSDAEAELIASLDMGDLGEETAAENTHLFGTKVIPQLRDLWADEPDHWTPEVSRQRVGARASASTLVGGS